MWAWEGPGEDSGCAPKGTEDFPSVFGELVLLISHMLCGFSSDI